MTSTAAVGAAVIVAISIAYVMWIRGLMQAPLPGQPHVFDPDHGVRFLGTARVDGKVAGWPRGQLVADRDVLMVRVPLGRDANADLVLNRRDVRSVVVQGGSLSRRVTIMTTGGGPSGGGPSGGDASRVAAMRFGAALSDPGPALTALGWPVTT
jgi:hypothetical protein